MDSLGWIGPTKQATREGILVQSWLSIDSVTHLAEPEF